MQELVQKPVTVGTKGPAGERCWRAGLWVGWQQLPLGTPSGSSQMATAPGGWQHKLDALHILMLLRPVALGDSLPVQLPPLPPSQGQPPSAINSWVARAWSPEKNEHQTGPSAQIPPPHEAGGMPRPGPDSRSAEQPDHQRDESPGPRRHSKTRSPPPAPGHPWGAWALSNRAPPPIPCDLGHDTVMFLGLS